VPLGKTSSAALGLRALVILVAGAGVGFALNAVRPAGLRFATFEAPTACEGPRADDAIAELGPRQTAAMCGRSDVVIADTRPARAFEEGHVVGAIHLPCDASGRVAADAIARLGTVKTVVVYGETTESARPVATTLHARLRAGVRVVVLDGGFEAWERANLACASGPCDDCEQASHSPERGAP
jgi:rhodanese-related sulfurtransferase